MTDAEELRIIHSLELRRKLRPIYRAAAEARIGAEWARRGEEARAYRERLNHANNT